MKRRIFRDHFFSLVSFPSGEEFLESISISKSLYLCALLLFCITIPAHSASVTLGWEAVSEGDLDHYVVYWRTSSSSYTDSAIVPGDTTNYRVTGLAANTKHYFAVTAVDRQNNESGISREVSWMKHDNPEDGERDLEWGINSGELKGFTILFSSNDLVPILGDSSEIPPPNLPGVNAVALPLNLQTEPQGVSFTIPVTIFIPCPGFSDVSDLDVYYYESGSGWVLASDADDPATVQPDAANWMLEGSRVNHNNGDPSTIEIQVHHFSGVQAAATSSGGSSSTSSRGGGGGCFIETAAFASEMSRYVEIFADCSRSHPTAKTAARYTLVPVTSVACIAIHAHKAILMATLAFFLLTFFLLSKCKRKS